jgi:hypothetical protein
MLSLSCPFPTATHPPVPVPSPSRVGIPGQEQARGVPRYESHTATANSCCLAAFRYSSGGGSTTIPGVATAAGELLAVPVIVLVVARADDPS